MASKKSLKGTLIFQHLKCIWENVIVYTLLDVFTALVTLVLVFIPVVLFYYVARSHLNIKIECIAVSFFVLTLLYMLSILIASWWKHYILVKSRIIKQIEPVEASQSDQNTQPPKETE